MARRGRSPAAPDHPPAGRQRAGQRRRGRATSGWTLEPGGTIVFAAAPAAGAEVRAGFLFDVPVRFAEDRLEIAGGLRRRGRGAQRPADRNPRDRRRSMTARTWFAGRARNRRDLLAGAAPRRDRAGLHQPRSRLVVRRGAAISPRPAWCLRRSAARSMVEPDSAEMKGALDHAAIRAERSGRRAVRRRGGERRAGRLGKRRAPRAVRRRRSARSARTARSFTAELLSAKTALDRELVPRTAPTCRAEFCGPGCTLSPPRFTRELRLAELDPDARRGAFDGLAAAEPIHLRAAALDRRERRRARRARCSTPTAPG